MIIKVETSIVDSTRLRNMLSNYKLSFKHRRNLKNNSVNHTIKVNNATEFRSAVMAICECVPDFH